MPWITDYLIDRLQIGLLQSIMEEMLQNRKEAHCEPHCHLSYSLSAQQASDSAQAHVMSRVFVMALLLLDASVGAVEHVADLYQHMSREGTHSTCAWRQYSPTVQVLAGVHDNHKLEYVQDFQLMQQTENRMHRSLWWW